MQNGDERKKNNGTVNREQYLINSKKFPYSQNSRVKLAYKGSKNYKFYIKEVRAPVNIQAKIKEKFNELKAAKKARQQDQSNKIIDATHIEDSKIIPVDKDLSNQSNML